jgi:hypothetical protein
MARFGELSSEDRHVRGFVMPSRRFALLAVCTLVGGLTAPVALAEPDAEVVTEPVAAAAPAADDGRVVSTPPQVTDTPDGWTLTLAAKNETQMANAPLTTALSSREYIVGGTYDGTLRGPDDPDEPHGTIEVGYQIGCGIDMSTSNGVALNGTMGFTPSLGFAGVDIPSPLPEGFLPVVSTPMTGGITIGLKPGIINIVPVTKKEFEGFDPWVMISNFHVKIDGCVGQSFIRSYAFLTRSTKMSDAIVAYYGTTKVV